MRRFVCLAAALVPTLALPCTPPRVDPWSITTEPGVTVSCELEDPAQQGKTDCSVIVVAGPAGRWTVPHRTFLKDEVWTVDGGKLLLAGGIAVTFFQRREPDSPAAVLRSGSLLPDLPRTLDIVSTLNATERKRLPKVANCRDPRHVKSARRVGNRIQLRVAQLEDGASLADLVFDVDPETLATTRGKAK
jgi:hypothetical protein